jgi:hypothetical protein
MKIHRTIIALSLVTGSIATAGSLSHGDEPTWSGGVIVRGEEREKIRSLPIEERPYRPFHFYGNTVRRMHYRGTPLPSTPEVVTLPTRVFAPRRF